MANIELYVEGFFPYESTVNLYPGSLWSATTSLPTGSPPGKSVGEAVVGGDAGVVEFTGLEENAKYS